MKGEGAPCFVDFVCVCTRTRSKKIGPSFSCTPAGAVIAVIITSRKTMRVCGVLLLLSAAARGLVSKAGSESQSPTEQRRLQNLNLPVHDSRNGLGLTRRGLFCRGGSATTGRGPEAAGCLAKQGAGKGALPVAAAAGAEKPWGAKQGWGQLRRSPEARASLSTELASRGMIRVCTPPLSSRGLVWFPRPWSWLSGYSIPSCSMPRVGLLLFSFASS